MVGLAAPLDTWHWRNPVPTGNRLNAVGSNADGYVAVGDLGTIVVSRDGNDWITVDSGTQNNLQAVAWGKGLWVVVGDFGQILTSPDGINWTSRPNGFFFNLTGAVWGNDLFVAVGENTSILTSPDGVIWTLRTTGSDPLLAVAWGNGTFAAVGGNPQTGGISRFLGEPLVLVSQDGVTWTYRDVAVAGQISCVTYGAGRFVAGTTALSTIVSTDGVQWTPGYASEGYSGIGIMSVAYVFDHFMATYGSPSIAPGTYLVSPDGALWTSQLGNVVNEPYMGNVSSLTVGPNGAVGIAHGLTYDLHNYLISSKEGRTWREVVGRLPDFESPVTFAGGRFFLREQSGYVNPYQLQPDTTYLISIDAQKWERVEASATNRFELPGYGNGLWVGPGAGGAVIVSTNAIDWQEVATGDTNQLSRCVFAGGLFIATGANGTLLISTNGIDWTRSGVASTNALGDVAWSGGTFALTEAGTSSVFTSGDAVTWSRHSLPTNIIATTSLRAWEEGFIALVSTDTYGVDQLLRSTDGVNWQPETPPTDDVFNFATGGGRLLAFRGDGSRVLYARSAGQTNWTTSVLPWVTRIQDVSFFAPAGVAFGQDSFVLTHSLGYVLQSDPMTNSAPQITQPLVSVAATSNAIVSLRVNAQGSAPLQYQWRQNGTNLASATLPFLALPASVISEDNISVVVSNVFGTNESARASVTVSTPATLAISADTSSLRLSGTPNGRYTIEYIPDLMADTEWSFFSEIELPSFGSSGRVKNLQMYWPPASQRFYRAVIGP